MGVTPCSHDFDLGPGFDNVFPHASADHGADLPNCFQQPKPIETTSSYSISKLFQRKATWATKKTKQNKTSTFHHTGCLIGILILEDYVLTQ